MRKGAAGRSLPGACLAGLVLLAAAGGSMESYGAVRHEVITYDRWIDTEEEDSSYRGSSYRDSSYTGRYASEEEMGGPGMVMDDEEEEASQSGPVVKKVTLTERFYEDYGIYEESMEDTFFLYSTVENGGLTNEAVTLDIPSNVLYTMEKDGVPWEYVSGQAVTEKGTYVVRLIGVENPELPLSRQTEYQAVFRFRIQDKLPGKEQESAAASGLAEGMGGLTGWDSDSVSAWSGFGQPGTGMGTGEAAESGFGPEGETEGGTAPGPEDGAGEETAGSLEETTKSSEEETQEPEGETESATETTADPETGSGQGQRQQAYDLASGRFLVTLENGKELVSNIPEGYVGPGAVEVIVSEEDALEAQLYREDEPIEYVRDQSLSEPGHYRLVLGGSSFAFTIASKVNQMEYYPAPTGMRFTAVSLDGQELALPSERYVRMEQDGVYTIQMTGEEETGLEVKLTKDTQPPEILVTVKGGTASIQYLSEDISEILLAKDGKQAESFSGYEVNSPGHYVLTVRDEAGNQAAAEFALSYHINAYGVAAVILVILLIAAGVVFVVHIKKTIKVR